MEADKINEILASIKSSPSFEKLGFVQKERILCPAYVKWIVNIVALSKIDYDRTYRIVSNHASVHEVFKKIYLEVFFKNNP